MSKDAPQINEEGQNKQRTLAYSVRMAYESFILLNI